MSSESGSGMKENSVLTWFFLGQKKCVDNIGIVFKIIDETNQKLRSESETGMYVLYIYPS